MDKKEDFRVLNEVERRDLDSTKKTIFEMKYESDGIEKLDIDCDFRVYVMRWGYSYYYS